MDWIAFLYGAIGAITFVLLAFSFMRWLDRNL
jgi:hypothetical protein